MPARRQRQGGVPLRPTTRHSGAASAVAQASGLRLPASRRKGWPARARRWGSFRLKAGLHAQALTGPRVVIGEAVGCGLVSKRRLQALPGGTPGTAGRRPAPPDPVTSSTAAIARSAPIFANTAVMFVVIAPVRALAGPVCTRTALVRAYIAPVCTGTALVRARTALVSPRIMPMLVPIVLVRVAFPAWWAVVAAERFATASVIAIEDQRVAAIGTALAKCRTRWSVRCSAVERVPAGEMARGCNGHRRCIHNKSAGVVPSDVGNPTEV